MVPDAQPPDSEALGTTGPDLRSGSTVAGYVIEDRLGTGGMAVVYRAIDQRLGRRVALKVLAPALSADIAFRHRFIRESRAAAAVDDPHIIPVFEAGEADGVLFIAMRYVPGGDVHTLVRDTGPLHAARAALILSQAASALDAAHRHGLVHRDVKPANMLMDISTDRPDHVYLSDFGLSKDAMSMSALTGTGMFIGTLDYIAPEQIDGQPVTGQADQYALACTAFELLSGAPPFQGDQPMPLIWAHMSELPPSLTARRPDLTSAVDQVLARAMAKVPGERFSTCREFTDALRRAIGLAPYDSGPRVLPVARTPTEVAELPPQAASPHKAERSLADRLLSGRQRAPDAGPTGRDPRRRRLLPIMLSGVSIFAAAGIVAGVLLARPSDGQAAHHAGGRRDRATTPAASGKGTARSTRATFAFLRSIGPGPASPGVNALVFSTSGSLAVAGNSGVIRLWDPRTGRLQKQLTDPGHHKLLAMASSPNRNLLAAGDSAGQTTVWDLSTARVKSTFVDPAFAPIESAAFSPDGHLLATGDGRGTVNLWDVATGSRVATLQDPRSKGADTVAFSPNGSMLASGDYNGVTYLWRIASRSMIGELAVPSGADVLSVAFSRDGRVLATGAFDGSTYLWDVRSAQQVAALTDPGSKNGVEALAFNPAGGTLATGDQYGNTYLWNLSDDRLIRALPSPATVWAVGFNHDGTLLAIGDHIGSTYVWRVG